MAEAEEQIAEDTQAEGGKKKIPLWVFILVGVQVVLFAGFVVAFLLLSGGSEDEALEEPSAAEQKVDPTKVKDPATLIGPQYDLEPFIVNLIDDGRGPRYLKVEVKFELESDAVRPEVEGRLAQIRDELLMLISSKRFTDIETSDGKRILKDEIFTRVNKLLVTGRIKRVYFTDFVIQ